MCIIHIFQRFPHARHFWNRCVDNMMSDLFNESMINSIILVHYQKKRFQHRWKNTFYIGGQTMLNRMLLKVKSFNSGPPTTVVERQHFFTSVLTQETMQKLNLLHRCYNRKRCKIAFFHIVGQLRNDVEVRRSTSVLS